MTTGGARDGQSLWCPQRRDRGGARTHHPAPPHDRVPAVPHPDRPGDPTRPRPTHLIVDNSSTLRQKRPAPHPCCHLHFTPTSLSWLNAVETWSILDAVSHARVRPPQRNFAHGTVVRCPWRATKRLQPSHQSISMMPQLLRSSGVGSTSAYARAERSGTRAAA